jgi:hypothetical protein
VGWGPTPALRQPITVIGIMIVSIVGLEAIRRQTVSEFPDVDQDHARALIARWLTGLRRRPIGPIGDGDGDRASTGTRPAMTPVAGRPAGSR